MRSNDEWQKIVTAFGTAFILVLIILFAVGVKEARAQNDTDFSERMKGASPVATSHQKERLHLTTERCEAYHRGFKDGYCSDERYVCYPPSWIPRCVEYDHRNEEAAYHTGWSHGVNARQSERRAGTKNQ